MELLGSRAARPTLAALLPLSLLFCKPPQAEQRRLTSQREFQLTGRAAIAVVKPLNAAGRLGSAELQFLEEFNRAGDSLERAGFMIAVTLRDTIVVIPPADSFQLSPWTIVNKHSAAFLFTPGRKPHELTPPLTREQFLMWVDASERWPRPARAVVTVRALSPTFRAVSVGSQHSCGLTADGKAFCWGWNQSGQLGNGTIVDATQPVAVAGGRRFVALSVGGIYTCGLIPGGAAFCWGANSGGRTPVAVAGGLRFVQLTAGNGQTCGLKQEGKAFCWGNNGMGQLGDGTSRQAGTSASVKKTPVAVRGQHRFVQISAGGGHTCARTAEGRVWCWGMNDAGQLGDGTKTWSATPVQVAGKLRFVELDALGYQHTCGRTGDGRTYCWGGNKSGQLGDSTVMERTIPTAVVGGHRFVELSAGNYHTCGRTAEGLAFCWGGSNNGERGDGIQGVTAMMPAAVAGGLRFVELRAGGGHTCARTKTGAAFCWGWNGHGELGDGTTMASQGPVQVVPRP